MAKKQSPRSKVDLQIRGMPVEVRDRLRTHARSKGLSMSRYVIDVIRDEVQRPTRAEWWEMWSKLPTHDLGMPASEILHEAAREEGWED